MRASWLVSFVVVALLSISVSSILDLMSYEDQTAEQKFQYIYQKVTSDVTPGEWPGKLKMAKLFLESMMPTVQFVSDEFPSGREKLIHSVGSAAPIQFKMHPDQPYTGLFKNVTFGFMRMSSAVQPDFSKPAENGDFIPGAGFKLLRTGRPSANFFAMHLLKPQDSWNFFKYPLSNHLSEANLPIPQHLLKVKFSSASKWANMVGLSDVAAFDQDGNAVPSNELKFPWQLIFNPNPELQRMFSDNFTASYFDQMATIPVGTTVYSISAMASPKEHPVEIGFVVTTGRFTTSSYADNAMFLKHQAFEEDLALRPEWLKDCPEPGSCPVCPVDIAC